MSDATTINRATVPASAREARAPMKYNLIDADQHLNPLQTFWKDYLPAKFRDQAPQVEHTPDGDFIVFEGRRKKMTVIVAVGGLKPEDYKMDASMKDMRPANWDPAARIADMDVDGVDAAIMYGGGPLGTGDPELYIESYRAYNRYVKDWCDHNRARLCPVGYVPMRDVAESVGFVKELAGMGFTTINMPAFPQNPVPVSRAAQQNDYMAAQTLALTGDATGDRQYSDAEFDPFWAALIEYNITPTFHLGGRKARFMNKNWLLIDQIMSKFAMCEPFAIMIHGGVFDRFPGLRFASVESGSGWVPFAADYMDRTWEKQRFWTESKILHEPSYYFDKHVYTSFIHDRIGIETRHYKGAKNLMWSSDYPHSETTWPDSRAWIERLFEGVPENERHPILAGYAQELFFPETL